MKINRIHILGSAGSGKSYGAKQLSKLLGYPHYDLDEIYWHKDDVDHTVKEDILKVKKELKKIVAKKQWVVEGAYSSWTDISFKRADLIIVLKPHRYIRTYRLIKRTIKTKLGLNKRKGEALNSLSALKEFYGFLKFNQDWEKRKLLQLKQRLQKHKKKVKYFNKADIAIEYVIRKTK